MLNLLDLTRLKDFRFPRTVIGYAVWAYHRFALSLRNVKDLLTSRGIIVSYETTRDWVARFGVQFAKNIRRDRPRPADKWHLDEVVIAIKARKNWLWRAVVSNGDVLGILVRSRRNKAAAKPEIAPGIEHRQHKSLNNRSEASHRHTHRREKIMSRFKSPGQAQRFLSVHEQAANLFRLKRHRLPAASYRPARNDAFALWAGYCPELTA